MSSQRPRAVASAVPPNEKLLIACMLVSADARAIARHYFSESDALERLELKTVFQAILSANTTDHPFSLSDVIGTLDTHLQRVLTEIGFAESGIAEEHAAEQALHCLKLLEVKSVQAKCESLKKRIRELELQQNFDDALRLMDELDKVSRASAKV